LSADFERAELFQNEQRQKLYTSNTKNVYLIWPPPSPEQDKAHLQSPTPHPSLSPTPPLREWAGKKKENGLKKEGKEVKKLNTI